jgi:hypothetical protein
MKRAIDWDFYLGVETAVAMHAGDAPAFAEPRPAERRSTVDTAGGDAEAWARRAMAASGFGDGDAAGPADRLHARGGLCAALARLLVS